MRQPVSKQGCALACLCARRCASRSARRAACCWPPNDTAWGQEARRRIPARKSPPPPARQETNRREAASFKRELLPRFDRGAANGSAAAPPPPVASSDACASKLVEDDHFSVRSLGATPLRLPPVPCVRHHVVGVSQLSAQAQRERRAGTRSKAASFVWVCARALLQRARDRSAAAGARRACM